VRGAAPRGRPCHAAQTAAARSPGAAAPTERGGREPCASSVPQHHMCHRAAHGTLYFVPSSTRPAITTKSAPLLSRCGLYSKIDRATKALSKEEEDVGHTGGAHP